MNRDLRSLMREVDRKARTCGWPECKAIVRPTLYLCNEHWRMIPTTFKDYWNGKTYGAANTPKLATYIDREIIMFKKTSENMQGREQRKAQYSRQNTGGIDQTAFSDDELKTRERILSEQLTQIQNKFSRVKAMVEEAALRRGTWGGRAIRPEVEARLLNEKRLLLGELNAVRVEHNKVKHAMASRATAIRSQENKDFDAIFRKLAKEMLATPIYERIIAATIHRVADNREESN